MSNQERIRGFYRVNSQDTMVSIPADRYSYLITPDSAFDALMKADRQLLDARRRGFRKRLAIPFLALVLLLVFVVGFRDMTSPFFWVLMGIFAAVSLVYALVWTDQAIVEYLPGAIGMMANVEDASDLFAHLTKKDRDTLFRAVEESGYSNDFLLEHLGRHYRLIRERRIDGDWRMPRWE